MKVRALQAVTLGPGTVLTLSVRQAARRSHQLAAEGVHRYRALTPVCFKAGEEFGVEAELPKALAEAIETDAPPPASRNPASKPTRVTPRAAPASPPVAPPDPATPDIG